MSFTSGEFRKALGIFPTGVAVVTARAPDGLLQGMTVSSFNSVSLEPPLVFFSVARAVASFSAWEAAKAWGVSVLGETQDGLSTRFAQSAGGKWLGFEPIIGVTGVPLIPGALAHFECERVRRARWRRPSRPYRPCIGTWSARGLGVTPCAYRKSNPGILTVQSTQNWATENESGCLGGA
jgi:hypothetical protein